MFKAMRNEHKILSMRNISEKTWVMRIERNGMEFTPGQYISIGPAGMVDMREYSLYSSPQKDYLEILFRAIDDGYVSLLLADMEEGQKVAVDGPFGEFVLPINYTEKNLLFVATGTGISPFHSFVESYPDLHYLLLHGCRTRGDQYDAQLYSPYLPCVSREHPLKEGARRKQCFYGRVTDYINRESDLSPDQIFICGNSDMIYDVMKIFRNRGYHREQLHGEVYF